MLDIEKLRKEIVDYYGTAFFGGGFGVAAIYASDAEYADEEKLIKMANDIKLDLSKFEL